MAFGLNKKYAVLSILLFAVELFIAMFIHDRIIRPFIGDMLVVILLFSLCRSFIKTGNFRLALSVLLFSYAVEIGQYFNLAANLGGGRLLRTILGTTFDYRDLLAYSAGILLVLAVDFIAKYFSRAES